MTHDDVRTKLADILVADFRVPANMIHDEATFRGTLGMDSLDAVDFTYMVKKTFGIDGDISAFADLHTVGKVVVYVAERLSAKSA
jgi:acyl carrier protein